MLTAFLTRADVARHLQALPLLHELKASFAARAASPSQATLRFEAPLPGGGTLVRQATLPGLPASCVTVRAELPDGTSRALLQLQDLASGKVLAVMDAGHLGTLLASVVGALAADVLARPDAGAVAVLGSGPAASSAVKALRLVRSLGQVWLYEADRAASFTLAQRLQTEGSMAVRAVDSAEEAVAGADLVVLTGGVTLPTDALRPGAHVTVLRADRFTRAPLPPSALARARRLGDQPEAPAAWAGPLHADLGEVLAGVAPGRTDARELTVFASTGPAFLDLLAAWHVFAGARGDEGLTRLDLEA